MAKQLNKIEKLISEHCPDGVEFRKLEEIFDIKNGYTPSKSKSEFWNNGTIPWFRMEDIRKNGRILNDSIQHITQKAVKNGKLFPADSIIIATTATIGEHALITVDSLANQQFSVLSKKENCSVEIDMKYMFYYGYVLCDWCRENTNFSGFASVRMEKFKKYKIPIPPLDIQKEIVKILDNFTELEAELESELESRKKQYEYYRSEILTFEDDVEFRELGEVCEVISGQSPKGEYYNENQKGLPFYQGKTEFQDIYIGKPKKWTTQVTKIALKDDILISVRAPVGPINLATQKICIGRGLASIRGSEKEINQKYLFYSLRDKEVCIKGNSGSIFSSINKKDIQKIKIPIPPLAEQKRIVSVLDKFDALVNDISIGLPAELDARRKQYEYYRNQLLTFKEEEYVSQ